MSPEDFRRNEIATQSSPAERGRSQSSKRLTNYLFWLPLSTICMYRIATFLQWNHDGTLAPAALDFYAPADQARQQIAAMAANCLSFGVADGSHKLQLSCSHCSHAPFRARQPQQGEDQRHDQDGLREKRLQRGINTQER